MVRREPPRAARTAAGRVRRAAGVLAPALGCAVLAAASFGGAPAAARAPSGSAVLRSITFKHVPKGYALAGIAWEDGTDPNATLTTEMPQGLLVGTAESLRRGDDVGAAVSPSGHIWMVGLAGEALGTKGQVVFQFAGPGGKQLCATSPVLAVPGNGTWAAVTIPVRAGPSGVIALPHYSWIRSTDGRWSHGAAAFGVFTTPNPTGYTLTFRRLPLSWQLRAFRFVSESHVFAASVAKALGQSGTSPYFEETGEGWAFTYPSSAAGLRGRLEIQFSTGHGGRTWLLGAPFKLRG